jgi:hypothetical protein
MRLQPQAPHESGTVNGGLRAYEETSGRKLFFKLRIKTRPWAKKEAALIPKSEGRSQTSKESAYFFLAAFFVVFFLAVFFAAFFLAAIFFSPV